MAESRRFSSNSSLTNVAQLPAVAKEPLERPRQATLAVGEVLAQHRIHLGRHALVDGLRLAQQALELAANDVHVHRRARVTERGEPDAQRALDEPGPGLGRAARHDRGRCRRR